MSNEINIYVADLSAYNAGILHGVWIDATADLDDIWDQINKMLADSPEESAEEYAIHDHEGFDGYSIGEYEGIENAHNIACFLEEFEGYGGDLLSIFNGNIEEARKAAEESYSGCYNSLADYAEELTSDTSEIPSHLENYIDYERMGRDMELSGDIYTIETAHDEVHIFWNH